jgi:hypothetical protein
MRNRSREKWRGTPEKNMRTVFLVLPLLGVMEIGLSMAAVGFCIAVKTLTVAVLMHPFGKLADKKDRVKLSMLGTGSQSG